MKNALLTVVHVKKKNKQNLKALVLEVAQFLKVIIPMER